jgi:hypothetical protein
VKVGTPRERGHSAAGVCHGHVTAPCPTQNFQEQEEEDVMTFWGKLNSQEICDSRPYPGPCRGSKISKAEKGILPFLVHIAAHPRAVSNM